MALFSFKGLVRKVRRKRWPIMVVLLTLVTCIRIAEITLSNTSPSPTAPQSEPSVSISIPASVDIPINITYIQLPDGINISEYPPFEPEVFTDFNVHDKGPPKIERIIHQTWMNKSIPPHFVNNVMSYIQCNPSWKYYLWTDESARQLISDYYPQLLPMWDGLSYSKHTIRRADALRYVVLYHFGGVYADLDTVNTRSLENAITKHACVFTPEPYEHAVIRGFVPYLLSNAVMLCASAHPFLKRLIDNLHLTEHFTNSVDSTGPGFITSQYMIYNNLSREKDHLVLYNDRRMDNVLDNSPYFYKGDKYSMTSKESVYIANTRYFMNKLDLTISSRIIKTCYPWSYLNYLTKRVCVNAKLLGLMRKRHRYAFIEHQWFMTWINWKTPEFENDTRLSRIDILDIVPDCAIYGEGS